jgi:hypothetical protein
VTNLPINWQNKKKGKKKKFKSIIKDKGIAFDDEIYYKGNEGITCTPMTIFKVITYAMKVLHTQQ